MNDNRKIDFVLLWVDGNDTQWQKEKNKYSKTKEDNKKTRYRDWDLLQYWFRGVEKYASWVNNIYFITWGHVPKWLNLQHPKLKIIKHKDFIPEEYLPTFNSNVIELNLFRIKDLSEQFVLFNDDVFIINKTNPKDFFIKGKPTDIYYEVNWDKEQESYLFRKMLENNYNLLNTEFNKLAQYKKNPFKYFNLKYGFVNNLRTLKMIKYNKFIGIYNPHISQSFLKSDFIRTYNKNKEKMDKVFSNKFRTENDLTNYLIRYYNLATGKFIPRKSLGTGFCVDSKKLHSYIISQKNKVVCLNDSDENVNFEKCKNFIKNTFEEILNEKSSYEK